MSQPGVKAVILNQLEKVIYDPLEAESQAELQAIAEKHSQAKNQNTCYFDYKGERYQINYIRGQRDNVSNLIPDLRPRMDKWLENKKTVLNTEKVFIMALFRKALNSSESIRDYKRLLPECVHSVLNEAMVNFHDLDPILSDEFVKQFLIDNETYCNQLKTRMMFNLLS